jgi:hypothetical protein
MRALINIKLPKGDTTDFIGSREFREILQQMGLRPNDMPPEDGVDTDANIREYCLTRAQSIFDRMPENTDEEKTRKDFTKRNIVFASDLPTSNTLFMVTAHTQSEYRFRLLNPKIEDLQEGCKEFILRIMEYNKTHPLKKLEIAGKIKILEHGLEEPTISGQVVENRWKVSRRLAARDYLITAVGLALFVVFTFVAHITPDGIIKTITDRLSTALFTATVVSGITVYYTFRQLTPVIQWTATYEKDIV